MTEFVGLPFNLCLTHYTLNVALLGCYLSHMHRGCAEIRLRGRKKKEKRARLSMQEFMKGGYYGIERKYPKVDSRS